MKASWTPKALIVVTLLIFGVALGLIHVRFEARKLQAKLNEVIEMQSQLEERARRFQIELATLTDYTKIHADSTTKYGMIFPDPTNGSMLVLEGQQ